MGGTSLSAFNCIVCLCFYIIIFLFPQSKSSFSLCKILMFISLLFLEWNMTLTCSWQVSWDSVFQWTETEMSFHRFILRTNHRIALNDRRLDLNGGKQQVFIRLLFVLETMDYERFDVKVRGVSADEVLYFILKSGSDCIWYPSGSSPRKSTAPLR